METSPKQILNEWAKTRKNKFVKDGMFTFERYTDEKHPFYKWMREHFLHIDMNHLTFNNIEELSKKQSKYYSPLSCQIVSWIMEIVDNLYDKNFSQYSKEELVGLKMNTGIYFYGKKDDKWIRVKNKKEYYNL